MKEWQQKVNRAVEETKRVEQLNAQKELNQVKQNYDSQIDVLNGQLQDFNDRVKQLEKELRERDHIIQGKDGEIAQRNSTIRDLESEIQRLKDLAANGDQATSEL